MPYPVISLFSGAGGLDMAVERVGEPSLLQDGTAGPLFIAVATDKDTDATKAYRMNFPNTPLVEGDIRKIPTADLLDAAGIRTGEAVLVVGGPPCTPFSKSGYWLEEKRTNADPNASLLDEFVRVVAEARPEAFVLENVQGLTYGIHSKQFTRLTTQLSELGYCPQWRVLLAAEYGVPQLRRRTFVVGRRDGQPLVFPEVTHGGLSEHQDSRQPGKLCFVTAGEAIGDLEPNEPEVVEVVDGVFGELASEVPPGQNYLWHTDRYEGRPVFKWRSRYWTFLLRLAPDRPSTTLQAQPGPWVGPFHWGNVPNDRGELRARRLRTPELLRLMTFPSTFALPENRRTTQRLIGNAVPVELGKVAAGHLWGNSTSVRFLRA